MSEGGNSRGEEVAVLERNRSLVFIDRRRKNRSVARPAADFLAQLIACEQRLGAFRRARRQDPEAGLQIYRTGHGAAPTALGSPGFERQV